MLVFLFLAALYESWSIPFAVLLALPLGLFGALLAVWLRAYPYDIYTQIGIVTLIGLAAKNAILIVEFARTRHEDGQSIRDAALEAARLRLRPILMTSFAFILGVTPLLIAHGRGRGFPPLAGHRGVRRHERGHAAGHLHRAGAVRGDPEDCGAQAEAPGIEPVTERPMRMMLCVLLARCFCCCPAAPWGRNYKRPCASALPGDIPRSAGGRLLAPWRLAGGHEVARCCFQTTRSSSSSRPRSSTTSISRIAAERVEEARARFRITAPTSIHFCTPTSRSSARTVLHSSAPVSR